MRTDGQTDIEKLIIAFPNFAKAPKNSQRWKIFNWIRNVSSRVLQLQTKKTNQRNSLDNHEQIFSMFAKNCEYKERHLQLHILESYSTKSHSRAQSNVSSLSSNSASTHTNTVQTITDVIFFWWGVAIAPQWAKVSSFMRFLDHIQRRTTVSRTPLVEWSARRRDLYLTTHNTHNRQTWFRWDLNPQSQQASSRRPTP